MNQIIKIIISILGAINVTFSIAIPILVSLLIISTYTLSEQTSFLLMFIGILSSLYRAINVGFMK